MSNKKKTPRGTLSKVLRAIRRYRGLLILSLLLAALTVALSLYIPVLVGQAIDQIIDAGRVNFDAILPILVKVGICAALAALAQWIMNAVNNKITYHTVRDMRAEAFRKIQSLPLKYLDGHPHGDIVSRVISDVDTFADGLLMGFTQLFTGVITILGTLLFMLTIRPSITAVVVLITPVSLLVARFIANRTHSMFALQSKTRGEQTAHIDEMVGNQKIVRAFGHEDEAIAEFDEINGRLEHASLRAIFFSSITNPATRFVNSLVYAAVGVSGGLMVLSTAANPAMAPFTVGNLSAFLSYANQYTKPFNEISGVITELQNALACAARLFDLIEQDALPSDEGKAELPTPRGEIVMEDITFSYTSERKLFEHFSLHIMPGQKVAIVGPTGCGKTTLINLLMRFYDVQGGRILVDGTDVRDVTYESLRRNFGMVLQDTWLKAGTVRENIAMGKPDATDDEIKEAAKAAHAHSFIKRLPQGYDSLIGEDGGGLSQGQRQLLCIARVMLCLPPILILDEATSSIDTRTEIRIQKAFDKMTAGRTSFIVAHRLSTIKEADLILVMKDGSIIEQGNHETLLRQGGFYAGLYESQFAQ